MTTWIRKARLGDGPYQLEMLARLAPQAGGRIECGLVHFAAGTRSPATGLHLNSLHEVAYVVSGKVLIETADARLEAVAGDCIIGSPAQPHATLGVEAAVLFFVLVAPMREVS